MKTAPCKTLEEGLELCQLTFRKFCQNDFNESRRIAAEFNDVSPFHQYMTTCMDMLFACTTMEKV